MTKPKTSSCGTAIPENSFIRSVAKSMRSHRLGDLMTDSGLISHDQLMEALAIQKTTRQQLGAILVERGYVSAVQLYRKLAEQWCIKVSAAGITLMMQLSPAAARADDGSNVRLAAAFAPASIKPETTKPKLFGTAEIRSNDISAFTKWTVVMQRFETQMKNDAQSPKVTQWKAQLQQMKGKSQRAQIEAVNNMVNQTRYIEDSNNYGKSDHWATPLEFFAKGGDCEDFAVAKFASLRALGFSSDQLRIAIVQDKIKRIAHAILIVYSDEGTFVLDNQDKSLRYMQDVSRYKPVYSINSTNWWLHRQPAGA
jgi:predicted transglutaminase-like cysteine proteinase